MTKNYPHEFQWLGVLVLSPGQETTYAAAASMARASGSRARQAYANVARPSPFSCPKSAVSEAFVCPSKGFNSTWHDLQELPIKVLLVLFSIGAHMR